MVIMNGNWWYKYNNDLTWKQIPVKDFVSTIPNGYDEIWISFRIQYTSNTSKPYITRDLYIGAGINQDQNPRIYADSYYFNEGNRVSWAIQYDPATRKISVLNTWINAYDDNVKFTPDKNLSIWCR